MKKLVKVEEIEGEGLLALIGKKVRLWCQIYIYEGTLTGVNTDCVLLEDAAVVYETGPLTSPSKDAQKLGGSAYVRVAAIELFQESP